jgi:hypothetical protein
MDALVDWNNMIFCNIKNEKIKNWLRKSENKNHWYFNSENLILLPYFKDGWHFSKALMTISIILSVMFGLSLTLYNFILCALIWFIGFELSFGIIFRKKRINKGLFYKKF